MYFRFAAGTPHRNEAVQWLTLRWGRMTRDVVFEDAKALDEACRRQAAANGDPVYVSW